MAGSQSITVGSYPVGGGSPLLWIIGPCVIESHDLTMQIAEKLKRYSESLKIPIVFKASFDKANRTSGKSFRGPGIQEGLKTLAAVNKDFFFPVTTDIHECHQASIAAEVCEVLQVPAFLARQTDLLEACGQTGRVVNVKKGQFMAPWDMKNVVSKLAEVGNRRVLLTERGSTFGYGMLVNDMRAIPWMQETGAPAIFDATHSVQKPGALGDRTGGIREMIPFLARAAVAAGCDGVFLETHPRPDEAKSDGPNALPLHELPDVIRVCLRIREAISQVPRA